MKYLKLFILIYTCIQLTYCKSKNDTTQKAVEGNTVVADQKNDEGIANGGPLNKSAFLKAMASLNNGELLDSVSMKNMLPPSLMNLDRISMTGKIVKQNKSVVSTTEVKYKANDKMIYVTITDAGKDSVYLMKLAPWSSMQFQNMRSDGYEKSIIVDGNKIDEKFNSGSHVAYLSVIYDNRILVDLMGVNCSMEELYSAF